MRRASVLLAAVSSSLLLSAGACQQDGPTAGGGDAAGIRADLAAVFAGDHPERRDTENGVCFADELTDRMTHEQLRDAGILDRSYDVKSPVPQLTERAATAWADAQIACTDFVEESTRAQVKATKGRLDRERYAACLRAALTDEQLRGAVVDSLTGDWQGADLAALGRDQAACAAEGTPD